jgi:hypothetical protein
MANVWPTIVVALGIRIARRSDGRVANNSYGRGAKKYLDLMSHRKKDKKMGGKKNQTRFCVSSYGRGAKKYLDLMSLLEVESSTRE